MKMREDRTGRMDGEYLLGRDLDQLVDDIMQAYRTDLGGEAVIVDDDPILSDEESYLSSLTSTTSEYLDRLTAIVGISPEKSLADSESLEYDEDDLEEFFEYAIDEKIDWADPQDVEDFSGIHRQLSVGEREDGYIQVTVSEAGPEYGELNPAD